MTIENVLGCAESVASFPGHHGYEIKSGSGLGTRLPSQQFDCTESAVWLCQVSSFDCAKSAVLIVPCQQFWLCHVSSFDCAKSAVLIAPSQQFWFLMFTSYDVMLLHWFVQNQDWWFGTAKKHSTVTRPFSSWEGGFWAWGYSSVYTKCPTRILCFRVCPSIAHLGNNHWLSFIWNKIIVFVNFFYLSTWAVWWLVCMIMAFS